MQGQPVTTIQEFKTKWGTKSHNLYIESILGSITEPTPHQVACSKILGELSADLESALKGVE